MKRAPVWIVAAVIALVAAALTLWLSPPTPAKEGEQATARRRQGFRTGRLARAERETAPEPVNHPRIAALAPGIAQILRDLGCGHLIVGRHGSDEWSDQSIPACGGQEGIDYERLISVNPTHVLLQWGERDVPPRLTSLAAERGWVLVSYPMRSLGDVAHATVAIYSAVAPMELDALRAQDRARVPLSERFSPHTVQYELERAPSVLSEQLDRALTNDPSLAGAGRVLLLYQGAGEGVGAASRPAALGPGSCSHDVLLRIGGQTATPTGKVFIPLDAEDIAALQPDAIIIIRPRKAGSPAPVTPPSADELLRSLGAAARLDIPAVNAKRIALIDDTMALVPGTNLSEFADRLRAVLKAWVPEMSPAATTR